MTKIEVMDYFSLLKGSELSYPFDNVTEVKEIKGLEPRISKNETDIQLINQRCKINHKE